ncbi:prepilin peptidase [Pseudomonas sp. LJDD11]|uniref:prepilin peptidase n=1 Tax=unclassified Pseudomonas TaxID=196821 RepID=UPI00209849CC|nr:MULTISPECIES: prepilin peptidase [unclassified Pseudomonas]MCO8165277.1 prepilin peptidase [Pseudomonas sp. 21LCFQ010]MCQ9425211.1 prepilin peptidase [Pseudomonas sp. LJDD11]
MKLLFLLIWFALCAEQDARRRQITNTLTLGACAAALGWLLYSGQTWLGAEPAEGGRALLLALAMTLPGYALGRLGGGDVKLLAALALASDSLYLLGTFIGAAVTVVVWLGVRRAVFGVLGHGLAARYSPMNPDSGEKFPFSPFLFTGLLLVALCIR